MTPEQEASVNNALLLRAQGGDADAARILFNEKSKRIRPVRFSDCDTLEHLKSAFEEYMAQADITKAESEHATKAFDRLFKLMVTREEVKFAHDKQRAQVSGLMLVPVVSITDWETEASLSQAALKQHARQ
ncbi:MULTISPECIES: hypothetical protein [unclassified Ruegeria]|uniref:hypothetical protein n=1 Tax=unclassified Ruegeria TaxID=2625375 RepID=UPI001489A927|nr:MULTISPECIES: hypothetical protein [unclassified Ruegeria]